MSHKFVGGGELLYYFNDEKGFREVKRLFVNSDAVVILENRLLDKYPEFRSSIKKVMPINNIKITGNENFIYPIHIQVEITEACNLHCEYCYRGSNSDIKHSKYISWPKLRHLLSDLKRAGMTEIGITGGEATLHPNFSEILRYVCKNFEQVELISNGTNAKVLEGAISRIPITDRRKLNLSISFNRWMHEYEMFLKGKHYLNKTIPTLSQYRPVRILGTDYIFDTKVWEILSIALKEYGAADVEYNIAKPIGRGENVIDISEYLRVRYGILTKEKTNEEWESRFNCGLVLRHTAIDPDGNARPCALFPVDHSFGNAFERGLSLFEDPEVIKYYYIQAPSKETCSGCTLQKYCEGCIFHGLYAKNEMCNYKTKSGLDGKYKNF